MRVRFPPSPTGALHIGNARTALYNWLLARGHGGTLVLRIEDTDRERSTPENVEPIFEALEWLGIDYDEGPIHQSERAGRHQEVVEQLLAGGHAYRSTAGPDDVKAFKEQHGNRGFRGEDEGSGAVRLRVPDEGATVVNDVIRGESAFENALLDDLVIARADGTPVYHLAVVVDDADAEISHVVRGADHYSNTPKQMLIQQAMGAPTPGLRAPAAPARPGRQEARQAPRGDLGAGPARPGLPARGGHQLPRAARLGVRRGDHVLLDRGPAAELQPRARVQVAGGVRRAETALDERSLPARAAGRRADAAARGPDGPQRARRRRRDLAGQDLHARRVLAARGLLLRRAGRRPRGARAGA